MSRKRTPDIPGRVRAYLETAVSDPVRPISIEALATLLGVSSETIRNHDRRCLAESNPGEQVIPLIKAAAERQAALANRIRRRRSTVEDAQTIQRLRSELADTTTRYNGILERWLILEINLKALGLDMDELLRPVSGKPDRSASRAGARRRQTNS